MCSTQRSAFTIEQYYSVSEKVEDHDKCFIFTDITYNLIYRMIYDL